MRDVTGCASCAGLSRGAARNLSTRWGPQGSQCNLGMALLDTLCRMLHVVWQSRRYVVAAMSWLGFTISPKRTDVGFDD